MKKIKIDWVRPFIDAYGNALGYSFHNNMMKKHTEHLIEHDPDSKIALHIFSGDWFRRIPKKCNVLFTMWEFLDVPESYKNALREADYVIVPSSFCRDIFQPYAKNKIYVCHEGVDPNIYKYSVRDLKGGQKFRYLWVGASNPRKGYFSVIQATKLADKFPQIEFYLKTTVKKMTLKETLLSFKRHWREICLEKNVNGKVRLISFMRILRRLPSPMNANRIFVYGKNKNIIVDTRKIPVEELAELYHSSHCFMFPSCGEGWGLTLCEAMATGLPCVSISETGEKDFFDDSVGYQVKTQVKEHPLENYNMKSCRIHIPDTQEFVEKLLQVPYEYDHAIKKAKKASERIHAKFTWDKSGVRLHEILKDIEKLESEKYGNLATASLGV